MIASTQITNNKIFAFKAVLVFKGILMQIWKSPCMLCLCKKNTLKISYLPVHFVNFFKIRLIFNIFYCFWVFVNKLFILFSYEDEDISRFSNLHLSTSRLLFINTKFNQKLLKSRLLFKNIANFMRKLL